MKLDLVSLFIFLIAFLLGFIYLYVRSSILLDSILAALINAALIFASFIVVRWFVLALRRK